MIQTQIDHLVKRRAEAYLEYENAFKKYAKSWSDYASRDVVPIHRHLDVQTDLQFLEQIKLQIDKLDHAIIVLKDVQGLIGK